MRHTLMAAVCALLPALALAQKAPKQDPDGTMQVHCVSGCGGSSSSASGPNTVSDPDVSIIIAGGSAVTAFAAGEVVSGGYLANPAGASAPLCIRMTGAAATVTSGGTTCIAAGMSFAIAPTSQAVSVNATNSGHAFSGQGFVAGEELAVLAREDVVGHGCYVVFVAESEAEGEHQGGFA